MALTTAAVIAAGASAYGAASSADAQRKSLHAQQDALKAGSDVTSLNNSTSDLARQNAMASAQLEKEMTPEVPQLRTAANNALLGQIHAGSGGLDKAEGLLSNGMGVPLNTPLLNAAIAKAQANLSLGGQLDTETQNAVTRKGLATAGTVGGGGLGLGRDVVARDLGLTSMQVAQQRLSDASKLGGQELDLGTANATNMLNHIQLLNTLNNSRTGNALGIANYAENIRRPIVGLDPGSAANLQVSGANAQGALAANAAELKAKQNQGYANIAGQLGGALLAYNNSRPTSNFVQPTDQSIYAATYAGIPQNSSASFSGGVF